MAPLVIDRTVPISIKVFSQCAGAGIDLFANWVSSYFSSDFKLSVHGQRNISAALTNLPVYGTHDERLVFGWTLDHALRNLHVHVYDGGYEHLALEAALSESFCEAYTATVLSDLSDAYAGEDDITPHFRQWRDYVHSSNGIFATVDFGLAVEEYRRMNPYRQGSTSGLAADIPSPKALALALKAVAEASSARDKRLTIVGGPVLGWMAAFVDRFLAGPIAVYSDQGDRLSVLEENQTTKILFVYHPQGGIGTDGGSWQSDSAQAKKAASRDSLATTNNAGRNLFGGRSTWQSLFEHAFGSRFHHLEHHDARALGTIVGCAAKILVTIYQTKMQADAETTAKKIPTPVLDNPIQALLNWFPEMNRLQGRMERQLSLSVEEAQARYQEHLKNLEAECACQYCSFTEKDPDEGFCLTALTETIIAIGLIFSRIAVTPQLYPAVHGIQSFYRNFQARRKTTMECQTCNVDYFKAVYGDQLDPCVALRLQTCVQLFSGSRPTDDIPENLVALSHEGICAYLLAIERSPQSGRTRNDGVIRLTSGGICWRQKIFTRACLGPVSEDDGVAGDPWEELKCVHLPQSLFCK